VTVPEVAVTRTAAGAVALLLYGARAGRETDDGLAEAILDLRALVGPELRQLVDHWIAEGGPDGEQIYCLDHLLQARLTDEPEFGPGVQNILGRGDVAADALRALSEHAISNGFRGAHAWCLTALTVPAVQGQAAPAPVNRTVTAPR
jgi:hypothetical protein